MKTFKFLTYCENDLKKRLLEIPKYKNVMTATQMELDTTMTKSWIKCVEWQKRILKVNKF